jgi:hypothetical protein
MATQFSPWRAGNICSYLFAARRAAERAGALDFAASRKVERVDNGPGPPIADLAANVEEGRRHRLGRIGFFRQSPLPDITVRRNMLLAEGQSFDRQFFRQGIARLNRPDPDTGEAGVTLELTERKHRAWEISGPWVPSRPRSARACSGGGRVCSSSPRRRHPSAWWLRLIPCFRSCRIEAPVRAGRGA